MGGVFYNNTIRRKKFAQSNEITRNSVLWLCWLLNDGSMILLTDVCKVSGSQKIQQTIGLFRCFVEGFKISNMKVVDLSCRWMNSGFFFFFARSFCPVSSLIQIICSISARRLQTFHPAKDQMCQTTDWHNLKKDMSMYELWVCGFSLLPNMDSKHVKTNKIDQLTLCAQTPQALQCENTLQFCLVCKRPQDKTKLKYLRRKCHSKATQWFWPLSYTHKDVFSPWRERKHFVRVCHLFLYKTRVLAQTHLK